MRAGMVPGQWYEVPRGAVHAGSFGVETDEIEIWFAAAPAV